jgi:hypothetical protein
MRTDEELQKDMHLILSNDHRRKVRQKLGHDPSTQELLDSWKKEPIERNQEPTPMFPFVTGQRGPAALTIWQIND